MLNGVLIKIVWLLAVIGPCYATSIKSESLETRLCRATFVFKFQVGTTALKRGQHAPPSNVSSTAAATTEKTAMLAATTTVKTTTGKTTKRTAITSSKQTAAERVTANAASKFNTTSPRRILNNQSPTRQSSRQQSTPTYSRKKRFPGFQEQGIYIPKASVIRGKDELRKMRRVQQFVNMYFTFLRLDLGFQNKLRNGDYFFIGRQIGRIQNHVFLSNPATVIPWSKSLEHKMNNFDFVKDCKRKSINPTRSEP